MKRILSTSELRALGIVLKSETSSNGTLKALGAKSTGSWVAEITRGQESLNVPITLLQQNQLAGRILGIPANLITAAQRSAVYQAIRSAIAGGAGLSLQLLIRPKYEDVANNIVEGVVSFDKNGVETREEWKGDSIINIADVIVTGAVMREFKEFLDTEAHATELIELKAAANANKVTRLPNKATNTNAAPPVDATTLANNTPETVVTTTVASADKVAENAPI